MKGKQNEILEEKAMWPSSQRMASYSHKPRKSGSYPIGSGKSKNRFFPTSSRGAQPCQHLDFGLVVLFEPPELKDLWFSGSNAAEKEHPSLCGESSSADKERGGCHVRVRWRWNVLNWFCVKGNFSPWCRSAPSFKAMGRMIFAFPPAGLGFGFGQGEGHDWNRA